MTDELEVVGQYLERQLKSAQSTKKFQQRELAKTDGVIDGLQDALNKVHSVAALRPKPEKIGK